VAIYHFSVKPIRRAQGRSATAAAAYRAAERVFDESSGETFDYTRKRGVEHTEIVLPSATARQDVNWARDRQQLWNAAEFAEKRKDARVAREYEVGLPHELKKAQRIELVQGFVAELANRYGVAVDFAIHKPHRAGDERNVHAHILTTTRQITATGLGAKAAIEWSDTDRARRGLGASKAELKAVRARWTAHANEYLKQQGIEARIDHRRLSEQGIEREATSHLGPSVSAMERRGIATEVGRRIAAQREAAARRRLELAAELGRIGQLEPQIGKALTTLDASLSTALKLRAQGQAISMLALRQQEAMENWLLYRIEQAEQALNAERRWAHGRERTENEPGRQAGGLEDDFSR
jgi:ATP-dependent exoDNAse (exonuclease V) alpha subunit